MKIFQTYAITYNEPREDHLYREQEWHMTDGTIVRIKTFRNGGTRTIAHVKGPGLRPWTHVTVTEARAMVKAAS